MLLTEMLTLYFFVCFVNIYLKKITLRINITGLIGL